MGAEDALAEGCRVLCPAVIVRVFGDASLFYVSRDGIHRNAVIALEIGLETYAFILRGDACYWGHGGTLWGGCAGAEGEVCVARRPRQLVLALEFFWWGWAGRAPTTLSGWLVMPSSRGSVPRITRSFMYVPPDRLKVDQCDTSIQITQRSH